jgi:hypothetical protein
MTLAPCNATLTTPILTEVTGCAHVTQINDLTLDIYEQVLSARVRSTRPPDAAAAHFVWAIKEARRRRGAATGPRRAVAPAPGR